MISKNELVFLSCLRNSSREKLTTISKEIGIPVSTLFEKLKKLEKSTITRHTVLLDFDKLGYSTRAKILLKVGKKDKENIRGYLSRSESVNSVFKITNGYDYLIETVFQNFNGLETFMEILEEKFTITKKEIFYIIDDVGRENFLSKTNLVKI